MLQRELRKRSEQQTAQNEDFSATQISNEFPATQISDSLPTPIER